MLIRDKLQKEWSEIFLKYRKGILHLCPRAGKIKTSINIINTIEEESGKKLKILIAYPDKNIQTSWEEDFKKFKYTNNDIYYITHISLEKVIKDKYDLIICDEIHLLSPKQRKNFYKLIQYNKNIPILGLSGTISLKTEEELEEDCGLEILHNYTLEEAVSDGIISDYKINIIKTDLDNIKIVNTKKNRTEKQQYNALTWIIDKTGPSLFLNLTRMRLIHNSSAKIKATKKILSSLKNERVLVFCANNNVANELGCKIHTTKNNNQEDFDQFAKDIAIHNHMALCKLGNTGRSFKNLYNIIINAFDSNGENLAQRISRSLILDEPGKVSNIWIITSKEKAELNWLNKALEFFNKDKIKYYDG